jgi:muramoyltetrapeptide carboxypeptidase LdcA involved in peptidoglycan recycling
VVEIIYPAKLMTVIGGYNSNELLPSLDWELIRANPKIFCGYSDITALQGAILARAGLVTYCGPHWSSFGMARHFGQTLRWFTAACPATIRCGWSRPRPGPTTCGSSTRTTASCSAPTAGGRCSAVTPRAGWWAATRH